MIHHRLQCFPSSLIVCPFCSTLLSMKIEICFWNPTWIPCLTVHCHFFLELSIWYKSGPFCHNWNIPHFSNVHFCCFLFRRVLLGLIHVLRVLLCYYCLGERHCVCHSNCDDFFHYFFLFLHLFCLASFQPSLQWSPSADLLATTDGTCSAVLPNPWISKVLLQVPKKSVSIQVGFIVP
jgi:hypothetical protein